MNSCRLDLRILLALCLAWLFLLASVLGHHSRNGYGFPFLVIELKPAGDARLIPFGLVANVFLAVLTACLAFWVFQWLALWRRSKMQFGLRHFLIAVAIIGVVVKVANDVPDPLISRRLLYGFDLLLNDGKSLGDDRVDWYSDFEVPFNAYAGAALMIAGFRAYQAWAAAARNWPESRP
jgi:hypothetical protein